MEIVCAMQAAARDAALSNPAFRLYVYLHGELDTREFRPLKVQCVAREVGLHYSNVTRHLKTLRETGYMERDTTRQPYRYRIAETHKLVAINP